MIREGTEELMDTGAGETREKEARRRREGRVDYQIIMDRRLTMATRSRYLMSF